MVNAKETEIKLIKEVINNHIKNCEIRVFGSRVNGNAKKYSDLDLCIVSNERISSKIIDQLRDIFSESELPYRVDILDWNEISDTFRKIIEKKYEII